MYHYDVVIIGGGVVGCATARELARFMVEEAYCVPINGYVTAYCTQNDVHIEDCVYDELQFLNRMWVEKPAA